MPGKPYHSKLNPYRQEIAELRHKRPPIPYTEIAKILNERHPGLNVSHNAVWAFVKSRSKGKKVLYMSLEDEAPPLPVAAEDDTRKEKERESIKKRPIHEPEPERKQSPYDY